MEEMLTFFDPNTINKSASAYNQDKLLWLNAHYIKEIPGERIIELLKPFGVDISAHPHRERLVGMLKERAKTIKEFAGMISQIIEKPKTYDEEALQKCVSAQALLLLEQYSQALHVAPHEGAEAFTKVFLENHGAKLKDLAPALRVAMVGSAVSPAIFEVLDVVGYLDVKERIQNLLSFKRSQS